uniref:Protein FAR1-RELATED SEQUENCE n=1 Tax=Lactuca sativa TaxID=4236 RepID=A0A9R1VDS1_LACSA|nr:hypothetical protein LSAT_V11C500287560 [Lactuca sativa]
MHLRNYAKLESKATYHLSIKQVLDYLNQVWLDKYKENFVSAWTKQVLNIHNDTNNRVERQRAKLKKFLQTHHANLDKFLNRIVKVGASQHTTIKYILETNQTKLMCRYNIPHFNELERPDAHQITKDDCCCQLHHSCGLPFTHKIAIYSHANLATPLSSIDKFWRKLDLINVNITNDANFGFEEGMEFLNERKCSYAIKLWDIFSPSTTIVVDSARTRFENLQCPTHTLTKINHLARTRFKNLQCPTHTLTNINHFILQTHL